MASTTVTVVGVEKLAKKLNFDQLIKPAQAILFHDEAEAGKAFLAGKLNANFPNTAGETAATSDPAFGKITAPRYPYIFFERGSAYPRAAGTTRSHRRRTGVKTGDLRIKPRRFLSQTRALIRRDLKVQILKMKAAIEKAWTA